MNLQKLYNPVVISLLRSPLNGLISASVLLITYTGRKSGKEHTIPVNYVRDGEDLLVVSPRERLWWRNLRGGAPVTVLVGGEQRRTTATAFEGEAAEAGLLAVLRASPAHRRLWKTHPEPDGRPASPEDLRRLAGGYAVVRMEVSLRSRE